MARVDPSDDSVRRYVIWHYRFDAARHERRNVELIAFDNETEFGEEINRLQLELNARKERGVAELVEHIGGTVKPPGHTTEQRRRRAESNSPSVSHDRGRGRHRSTG